MLKKALYSLLAIFLLALIILSTLFSLLQFENGFNSKYRGAFAGNRFLRKIFIMDRPGDAARDYLDSLAYPKLLIEIIGINGRELRKPVEENFKKKIGPLLGKEVEIVSHTAELSNRSVAELNRGIEKKRKYGQTHNRAYLLLVLYSYNDIHPSNVGTTLSPTSVALFFDPFSDLSGDEFDALMETTVYHELGHLIGLEHSVGSIMDENVEVGRGEIDRRDLWFSKEELEYIDRMKRKYSNA